MAMTWRLHDGGNGPDPEAMVIPRIRVLSRSHVEEKGVPTLASKWRWPLGRQKSPGDIVEYLA